jgi:hypothetical protein
MGPTLSVGGPRGRAEEPRCLERDAGVPCLLEGPISDSKASDIITEAMMGDWASGKLENSGVDVRREFVLESKAGSHVGVEVASQRAFCAMTRQRLP